MNRLSISTIVLSTLTLCACTSEEESVISSSEPPQTIEISTYVGQSTRAIDKTAFESGDVIGLYACQTTGDYENIFTAGFMDNVAVTKGESGWTYSPITTWPADDNEHLSFTAFCPRITTGTATTYPFTVNTDPAQQTDPLWCTIRDASINDRNGKAINGSETDASFEPTSGALNLKFKHMLAKVRVKVKLNGSYPGITAVLNSLSVTNVYSSGTFTIASDLSNGSWSTSGSTTSFILHSPSATAMAVTNEAALVGDDLLMIPQSVRSAGISLQYTHTVSSGETKTIDKFVSLPEKWEVNKTYNYTVNLSLDTDDLIITADIEDRDEENVEFPIVHTPADAVDMGLSVKWASYNVGANAPEDSGLYYAWGETDDDKSDFSWTTYIWDAGTTGRNLTKYCTSSQYGTVDYKTVLEQADDVAHVKWGGAWRMPTDAEWTELLNGCTWTWTTLNGVDGYRATSKTTGNSIFLPAAGYRYGTSGSYNGTYGYYWSSSLYSSSNGACDFFFYNSDVMCSSYIRYYGCSVRPVTE